MVQIRDYPVINNILNAGLAYGIAYAGQKSLQINPLHAAIFAIATNSLYFLARCIASATVGSNYYNKFLGRAILNLDLLVPVLAVVQKKLSLQQTLTAYVITSISDRITYVFRGPSK